MTDAFNSAQDYQQNYLQQFKQQARLGTTRRLGSRNIMITDGGNAKKIGNNTYLLRGGSHEDINETGQTGIGINVVGTEQNEDGFRKIDVEYVVTSSNIPRLLTLYTDNY